ncbi:Laccase [Lachnellula subtilissima]|uniref:Laccase n=1 Tax=Lachnellula subtilissima TaxID=602034 RepID=A0A8H8RFJ9_9HELO|nr:Laccase [Lachnellula subtilissima]
MTNILLNGHGRYGPAGGGREKYQVTVDAGERHMLILINTALDTTFVFSIDDHELEIIEMDFVPIRPYKRNSILVGIGQRYHVIITAKPPKHVRNVNYWIRTIPARQCSSFSCEPDEKMGILRYNTTTDPAAKIADPLSAPFLFDVACADEPYENLIPYQPWTVGEPANISMSWFTFASMVLIGPLDTSSTTTPPPDQAHNFEIHMTESSGLPYIPEKALLRWTMHQAPFRINYSDPTILDLKRETWGKTLDVITLDNKTEDQWIWLAITAPGEVPPDGEGLFIPAAHPMHLHGHDFALLKQSSDPWNATETELNCNGKGIKCNNPPRRDVALLPASGYLIIAFKADNPGPWLIHCHIAFHASSGLAMQVIENKHLIPPTFGEDKQVLEETCRKWDAWLEDPLNHWDFHDTSHFQDDSGV